METVQICPDIWSKIRTSSKIWHKCCRVQIESESDSFLCQVEQNPLIQVWFAQVVRTMQYGWLIQGSSDFFCATYFVDEQTSSSYMNTTTYFSHEQQNSTQSISHLFWPANDFPSNFTIFLSCPVVSALDAPVSRTFGLVFDFSQFAKTKGKFCVMSAVPLSPNSGSALQGRRRRSRVQATGKLVTHNVFL